MYIYKRGSFREMESTGDTRCYLSLCPGDENENYGNSRSISRKLRCGVPPMCGFNSGSRYLVVLMVLTTATLVQSSMPEKYPIEVYHMLQERSQYGIGRDNRVRGSWGPWSSWSECSRSCGTGVQSQARECSPPRGLRKRSVMNEVNTTSLKPICIGTYKRYHICNTQDCPNYQEDTRAEQCAKFNNRIYKGESYNWVPFLNAPNPCALNCRAVGQRFYATLEPEVLDGTPCDGPNLRGKSTGFTIDRTEQWLCVAGQCRPVGCDGVVGSGAVRDTCGVCGGQGRGCKLFEGIFMEPILPKGHQPVTTIPRGAMSLNISELRYSGNFLALKSDNGSYILNGPNSVSPSGIYKTAGTILKYQRGDKQRMESITGTGPLNESLNLEILFHEMNPGILYKYMLPAPEEIPDDNTVIAPPLYAPGSVANEIPDRSFRIIPSDPVHESLPQMSPSRNQVKDTSNSRKNEEMKFSPTTVMAGDAPTINSSGKKKKKKRKFAWRIRGLTPCSKTCGGGTQIGVLKCVREDTGFEVPDKRCRKIEKPTSPPPLQCNDRPCPARWRADSWSECSVTCGAGVKTRRLECVQDLNSKLTMRVAAGACSQPPDLSTVNSCAGPPCPNPEVRQMISTQRDTPPRWDVGMWGPCSSTCGKGVRSRTVTCITTREPCSQSAKPIDERPCETPCNHPLQHEKSSWLQSEWSPKCTDECDREVETRRIACGDVNESFCDPRERPVTERRCSTNETKICNEAKWYTGPWSSCSVLCGEGIAYRDVICIGKLLGESKVLSESNCTSTRPHTEEICSMPPCPPEWYTSDWSECSASCGGGMQERIVRCIENNLDSTKCEMRDKPINRKRCNVENCRKEYSHKIPKKVHLVDGCTDKYPNCELVVRAGLCRIKFYKHSCCGCRN